MAFSPGDEVTIRPAGEDPIILHMQRYAHVVRWEGGGFVVRLTDARPTDYGPIPSSRLEPGWKDARGRWR